MRDPMNRGLKEHPNRAPHAWRPCNNERPDEQGTESDSQLRENRQFVHVTMRDPMNRGLKDLLDAVGLRLVAL